MSLASALLAAALCAAASDQLLATLENPPDAHQWQRYWDAVEQAAQQRRVDAVPLLERRLRDLPQYESRAPYLKALARIGGPGLDLVLEELERELRKGYYPNGAQGALEALAHSQEERALRRLLAAALDDPSKEVRDWAGQRLRYSVNFVGKAAVPFVLEELARRRGGYERERLLYVLGDARDERAVSQLTLLLNDPSVGNPAAWALGAYGTPQALRALERAVRAEADYETAALGGLGRTSEGVPALVRLLDHPNPYTRYQVVGILCERRTPLALEGLMRAAGDPAKDAAHNARWCLENAAREKVQAAPPLPLVRRWPWLPEAARFLHALGIPLSSVLFAGLLLGFVGQARPARSLPAGLFLVLEGLWGDPLVYEAGALPAAAAVRLALLAALCLSLPVTGLAARLKPSAARMVLWAAAVPGLAVLSAPVLAASQAWAAGRPGYQWLLLALALLCAAAALAASARASRAALWAATLSVSVPAAAVLWDAAAAREWDTAAAAALLTAGLFWLSARGAPQPEGEPLRPAGRLRALPGPGGLLVLLPRKALWQTMSLSLHGGAFTAAAAGIGYAAKGGDASGMVFASAGIGLIGGTMAFVPLFGVLGRPAALRRDGSWRRFRLIAGFSFLSDEWRAKFGADGDDPKLTPEESRWLEGAE